MSNATPSVQSQDIFEKALARYNGLPRASRWLVIACVGFGGFALLDSVLWPIADEWNRRADRLELVLKRASERAEELPDSVTQAAIALGPNSVPKLEEVGKEKLASAIAEILKKKGVTAGQDIRPAQPLPESVLPDVAAEKGGKMGRTVAEVRFEATPDAVTAILSEFESSPAIDAITDITLSYKAETKRVSVTMNLEKWGVVRKTVRGGA
jgi:hypothetical protein